MLQPFFHLAMIAPGRHKTFRRVVVGHVLFVSLLAWFLIAGGAAPDPTTAGYILVALGMVEGAALVGWRLSQMPKSQALEFLLISPIQPRRLFLGEFLVGVCRFALVQLTALPIFLGLQLFGFLEFRDFGPLFLLPFVWGLALSALLTAWVYESTTLRRIGELVAMLGVLVYLIVGVLAAEKILEWLALLPSGLGQFLAEGVRFGHDWNPFGAVRYWFASDSYEWIAEERLSWMIAAGLAIALLASLRAAFRLKGHFHDRHYKPIDSERESQSEHIGERPLSWWAVRRVMEYSGRVNVYLAGGFSLLYAAYLIAGDNWPSWMGKLVFQLFDRWGGPSTVATAMAVLAAVPAVFQFGLWDSTVQNRCKRLELLLLTELTGWDYWHASLSAAWKRGRAYLAIGGVLWSALAISGAIPWWCALAAFAGAAVYWAFAFALGFRAFATGNQSSGLASGFTLGLPLVLFGTIQLGWTDWAGFLPIGLSYLPSAGQLPASWFLGFALTSILAVRMTRNGLTRCESDLRKWYDANQGRKSEE